MASKGQWAQLANVERWKPSVRRRALAWWAGAVTIFSILAIILAAGSIIFRPDPPADTYLAVSKATRASNFGSGALLVWLAGTPSMKDTLLSMSSAADDITLGETPFEIRQIEPGDIQHFSGDDADEWVLDYTATMLPPGSGGRLQRLRYQVIALERGGAFQLLTWPTPVISSPTPFKIKTQYTGSVSRGTSAWDAVSRFAKAYLASSKDGKSVDLGLVTSNYKGGQLGSSPYANVEVQKIQTTASSTEVDAAREGTAIQVIAEVKASATTTSWHIVSLPLTLVRGADSNVWLVDHLDAPLRWGEISAR